MSSWPSARASTSGATYTVDETALRHGAGVSEETSDREKAYTDAPKGSLVPYRDGWLPD